MLPEQEKFYSYKTQCLKQRPFFYFFAGNINVDEPNISIFKARLKKYMNIS